jgi:hypothetical protein
VPAKRDMATRATAKNGTAKKARVRASSQPERAPARGSARPSRRGSALTAPGLILIDSTQVGSRLARARFWKSSMVR